MLNILTDIIIIIVTIFLFGLLHSFLASMKVKVYLKQNYPHILPFYRFGYNLISLIILYLFFIYLPFPDITVYDLIKPYDFIILGFQFLSLLGLIWTFRFFSFLEFAGISQVLRWYKGNYDFNELDEKMTFKIKGPYRYIRHPVYFFSILFLVFRPIMDLSYLVIVVSFIIYFYVGSFYEEKKLIRIFGEEYRSYQKLVPRIFPLRPFHPYSPGS